MPWGVLYFSLLFKMNTSSYQVFYPSSSGRCSCAQCTAQLDWLDLPWGGPYPDEEEEDLPIALCGEWGCSGDCFICVEAEAAIQRIFLPIYGPVNRDGAALGYLVVRD